MAIAALPLMAEDDASVTNALITPHPSVVVDEGEAIPIDSETKGLEKPEEVPEDAKEAFLKFDAGWDQGFIYSISQRALFKEYAPWMPRFEARKLEGRAGIKMHIDGAFFSESDGMTPEDGGVELRRGRVYTLGNTYFLSPMDYRIEFGLSGRRFAFTEGYLRWNDVPLLQTIQAGQFDAPMSLENLGSSGSATFMESGLPVLAFAPGSRLGLQIGGPFIERRMSLFAGVYADVANLDVGDATEKAAGPVGRFVWSPVLKQGGNRTTLLHLGGSLSYTQSRSDAFRYRSTPESYLAPYLVDTGDILGADAWLYGLEAAAVRGPLRLQAEAMQSLLTDDSDQTLNFWGIYGYAAWYLTGESQPYNDNRGVFSRIRPQAPFSLKERRWGAWEVAARASMVDLSDREIQGGKLWDLSGGLNWYWTRDCRLMFNYIYANVRDVEEEGYVHILQTRLQLEF